MGRGGIDKIKMGMVGAVWGQARKKILRNWQVSRSNNCSVIVFIIKFIVPSLLYKCCSFYDPKEEKIRKDFHATTPMSKEAKERRKEKGICLAPLLLCALA